jgi:hypothetical protein
MPPAGAATSPAQVDADLEPPLATGADHRELLGAAQADVGPLGGLFEHAEPGQLGEQRFVQGPQRRLAAGVDRGERIASSRRREVRCLPRQRDRIGVAVAHAELRLCRPLCCRTPCS